MQKKSKEFLAAIVLVVFGMLGLGISSAHAVPSTVSTLNASSTTIKGVNVGSVIATTCLDGPTCASFHTQQVTVTLTSAQAADTSNSGSFVTSFVPTHGGATVNKIVKHSNFSLPYNVTLFNAASAYDPTTALSNGDVIIVKVTAEDGIVFNYYGFKISAPISGGPGSSAGSSSSSGSTNTSATGFAQSLATQYLQLVRVQTARTTLLTGLSANKSGTLAQYAAAEIDIKSEAALARVNAKVLALPAAQRSNVNEIAKIVNLENFVDSVSTSEIHSGTIAAQLVSNGFIGADNRLKLSLANALRTRPASSIDSVEEIKVAIVEETARLQERIKRTTEIKAKIAARNK